MTFSGPKERFIRDFAARMGLDAPPGPRKVYSFQFAGGCSFTLTSVPNSDRTIGSMIFKPRFWDDRILEKLFDLAAREWEEGRLIRSSITSAQEIVLAVDIEAMSLQALDDCLRTLLELSQSLRQR